MAASVAEAFGPFDRVWVNTAHQGPLPQVAADVARRAVEEKLDPRPAARDERSTLVFLEPDSPDTVDRALARLDSAGVDAGERTGKLRLSPHVHNTPEDVEQVLAALSA